MKKYFFLVIMAVAGFIGTPAGADDNNSKKTYTLFASGDTNLARWVSQSVYSNGPTWGLEQVIHLSKDADVALTNLECVLSTTGQWFDKGERRPYLYRGRPEMIDVLTEAGYDVVAVANNHALDYGPDALMEQSEMLRASGVAPAGAGVNAEDAARPTYVKVGDLILAIISMETEFPEFKAPEDSPGIFHAKGEKNIKKALKKTIAMAREHADLVVFTPHWGDNWTDNVEPWRRDLAYWIMDQGVDAILGHSSHHLHGIEIYKGKPIIYDMGSYFFDRVHQKRMSYSAGFVLDFDREGFKKVTIHPVRPDRNITRSANPTEVKKIHGLLDRTSKELDPSIEFEHEGDALVLNLNPETPSKGRSKEPEKVHVAGTESRLPDKYRDRISDVVVDKAPEWTKGFEPVKYAQGLTVVGGRSSDAVWPGRAFKVEVILDVSGPLDGSWVAIIRMEKGGKVYDWHHPIADAAWNPALWKEGQIVIDRTLVRPKKLTKGTWKLSWGLKSLKKRKNRYLKLLDSSQGKKNFVPFDEIIVSKKGVPEGAAGLVWDGWLPGSPDFDKKSFEEAINKDKTLPMIIFFVASGAVILIALAIIFFVRRSRKKAALGKPSEE